MTTFVCPDCKSPLQNLHGTGCAGGCSFELRDDIPVLLSKEPQFQSAASIGDIYNEIYTNRSGVWEDQGRTKEFISYFSDLVASQSTGKLLEIGCGEGVLLSAIKSTDRTAVDISVRALSLAKKRTAANCAVACAERLPFPDGHFDIIVSVGVMEHFLDDKAACSEIHRTLKPGGAYVALIHVALTRQQELAQKIREFLWPMPHPLRLLKWLISKFYKPIYQPIQRRYTEQSGKECIEGGGLKVHTIVSKARTPTAPLIGPHVVIYVCNKSTSANARTQ